MVLVHPEYALLILEINDLKDQIAGLMVEKDMLEAYICKDLRIDYMLKLGTLEHKLLVAENGYKKNVRKLELIEEKLSKGNKINIDAINRKVNSEFKKQTKLEKDMSDLIDFSIEMSAFDWLDYDLMEEINIDYLKLQKLYNPIFDLEESEEKRKNFQKIEKYYHKHKLSKLHKLAKNCDLEEIFQDEISNLKKLRIKYKLILPAIQKDIRRIKNHFPYSQKRILEDETLCRRKKDFLNRQTDSYLKKNSKIEKKIENSLKK